MVLQFSISTALLLNDVKENVNKSIKALGLSIGETHTEVSIKKEKTYLIEIAARGGGIQISLILKM